MSRVIRVDQEVYAYTMRAVGLLTLATGRKVTPSRAILFLIHLRGRE